jgi:signal transduction histidine kinase
VSDPEAVGWMHEIDQASEELDKTFRAKAAARAEDAGAPTSDPDLRSYALLMLVEDHVDGFIARLGQATATARAELVALEERAIRWTAILLVVVALLVAVAVLYLSRFVARPLARLSEGAARLAGGDLEAHIDIHTPDEFGALAAKFNSMTVALKQHQEKLVESEKHAGIGRVAAGLAHELNNPLQVMLGYLSLNRDVPDRRLAEQLAAVEEETLRCKEIVESMLEVSRNTTAITQAAVDLRSLCEEVTGKLRGLLPGPIELRVRGAGRAVADPVKLRQAVFNLIKNAVEASGPAGAVRIDVGVAGDTVEVEVGDSGPGIPHEARARLFEPFYTTKATGTGLGLAVSRAIARAQGGDIDFRNREAGGAVFTLRLPRAPEGGA